MKLANIREEYLLVGGAAGSVLYAVLIVIYFTTGWVLPFPVSLAWLLIAAIPAAAIAVLFLQAHSSRFEDRTDHHDPEQRGNAS